MRYYGYEPKKLIFRTEEQYNDYIRPDCYWETDFTEWVKNHYPDALECYLGALACDYKHDDILFYFPLMLRECTKSFGLKHLRMIEEDEVDKYLKDGWRWNEAP